MDELEIIRKNMKNKKTKQVKESNSNIFKLNIGYSKS